MAITRPGNGPQRLSRNVNGSAIWCDHLANRDNTMTRKSLPLSDGRSQSVRVRLQRINCDFAKVHPADGEGKLWWARLNKALGTSSSAFVNASLFQLQGAARLPGDGISEVAVNAALALIEAVAPKDEVEAALAVQMAATHSAAMTVLVRLGGGHGGERRVAALGSAAARLLRAYTHQVELMPPVRDWGRT